MYQKEFIATIRWRKNNRCIKPVY